VPRFGWYGGEVLEARVDGWHSARRATTGGPVPVVATLGPVTHAAARVRRGDTDGGRTVPFLYVHDTADRLLLALSQGGPDLTVAVRRRGDRWRLRAPVVRFAGVLAPVYARGPHAVADVRVRLAGDTVTAVVATPGARPAAVTAVVGPSVAWSLMVPSAWVTGSARLPLTAAWFGVWLAPLGYWARWAWAGAARPPLAAAAMGAGLAAALAGGLAVVPALAGASGATAAEWAVALAAVALGWSAAHALGRPPRGARLLPAPRPGHL
jgi:hypothetical protein